MDLAKLDTQDCVRDRVRVNVTVTATGRECYSEALCSSMARASVSAFLDSMFTRVSARRTSSFEHGGVLDWRHAAVDR